MNLHTSLRYPFFKFLFEEFSGSFYKNDLTSLHRMLILYHNRYIFSIEPSRVSQFLDDHQHGLSKFDWLHWYLHKTKRKRIQLVRARTVFILKQQRSFIEELLLRKDYSAPDAVRLTLSKILRWLEAQSDEIVTDEPIDLAAWKNELEILLDRLSETNQNKKPSLSLVENILFFELFTGRDKAEKRGKFDRLIRLLVEHSWIVLGDKADVYQFHKQRKGGRLYIGALYYVLNEKGYISKALDAPQIATLFDSWLTHNFEQSSFLKVFQAEEQAQFDCGPNDQRYKYVSEARLLLKDF